MICVTNKYNIYVINHFVDFYGLQLLVICQLAQGSAEKVKYCFSRIPHPTWYDQQYIQKTRRLTHHVNCSGSQPTEKIHGPRARGYVGLAKDTVQSFLSNCIKESDTELWTVEESVRKQWLLPSTANSTLCFMIHLSFHMPLSICYGGQVGQV